MPPSRCCTVRRLPSGLTTPGAIAAPASGALAAHQPRPPKNRPISSAPARTWRRSSCMSGCVAPPAARDPGRRCSSGRRRRAITTPPRRPRAPPAAPSGAAAPPRAARTATPAPSRRTSSLSTWTSRLGRCATRITVVPCALSRPMASISAASPAWSRLAFGSSSTTRRGWPNIARASPIHCRWPPESTAPCAPISAP